MAPTVVKYTPRPYQDLLTAHILDPWIPRSGVMARMGMGKTVATLTALSIFDLVDPGPTLILAPLRVVRSVWPQEAAKWDHLAGFDVVPVIGNVEERKAALKRPAHAYAIHYDMLEWLYEHQKDQGRWPFVRVIADESTRLKGFRGSVQVSKKGKVFLRAGGGKRAMTLARAAWGTTHGWVNQTGTPSPNGLKDVWGQTWFLDQGRALGNSYSDFQGRFFYVDKYSGEVIIKPGSEAVIHNKLRQYYISVDPKDYFKLEDPIVKEVRVELPAEARRIYRKMERDMFASISGEDVTATMAATKSLKCLQLASGAAYTDEGNGQWVEVHDAKLQALESILQEAGGTPILVAYHFKSDLARIRRTFPEARELDDDPRTIDEWNAGRVPILLAHPASAGHGLNLQDGGNIIVFFSHWWDLELYEQIVERIGPVRQLQAGHKRNVWIYLIIANDTVDDDVIARRASKTSVQDALRAAMKRVDPAT